MRNTLVLAFAIVGLFLSGASRAQATDLLFDYVGYDYEDPDPNSATFGEVGSGYIGVGFCPVLFAPLTPDTTVNEYTYQIGGLTSVTVTPVGSFLIIDYSGPGYLRVYEDDLGSGTNGTYGINPPNGSSPTSFNDGTLFLDGQITNFQVILNTGTGSGSYEATFMAVGGSQLGNIPANQRDGWTFSGITSNELNRPEGYEHQVDGQVFLDPPIAVEPTSWSRIKRDPRSN